MNTEGHTGSNNLTAWDGLNYAGFLYDADSGNYSESLVITNIDWQEDTRRRSHIYKLHGSANIYKLQASVPYAVTKINDKTTWNGLVVCHIQPGRE